MPRSRSRLGAVLRNRAHIVSIATSMLLVAAFFAMELAIVARFDHDKMIAGLASAVSSVDSLIGGLAFGRRQLSVTGTVFTPRSAASTSLSRSHPG